MINISNYQEMDCPVCGEFHFSKLDESDIALCDYIQCPHCGWKSDYNQTRDPNLKQGTNFYSLNEYRTWFEMKISKDPNFDYMEDAYARQKHTCPVCGEHTFSDTGSFEICPQCGWIDDPLMEEQPDKWAGCSNELCLTDYKQRYIEYKSCNPRYRYSSDGYPSVSSKIEP